MFWPQWNKKAEKQKEISLRFKVLQCTPVRHLLKLCVVYVYVSLALYCLLLLRLQDKLPSASVMLS